jgi:uncharacterized membrane protein
MPFCPSCGAAVEGKFCAKCGTPMSGGAPGAGPSAAPPPSAGAPAASELAPNVAATLCYIPIWIPAILFLVLAPYNRDKAIRFHAWQSLFLHIAWVVAWMVLRVVLTTVSWTLAYTLSSLLSLGGIVLMLVLMLKTYQGQKIVLPVLGPLAEKQA